MYTPRAPAAWIASPWAIIGIDTFSRVCLFVFASMSQSSNFVLLFDLSVLLLMLMNHIMHADISQVALAKLSPT